MKTNTLLWVSLLIIALLAGGIYLNPLLQIITGYAAKNLASGIFVGNRSQQEMEQEDLNFSLIRLAKSQIDYTEKSVTSCFLWGQSKAIHIDGFGCTLVKDYSEEEIKGRNYPTTPYPPYDAAQRAWPMGDLLQGPTPEGISLPRLGVFVEDLFSDNPLYKGTFGFLAVYKGQLVAERYREEFSMNTRFLGWSVAKSITSALVGIRAGEGKIDRHQSLTIGGISQATNINQLLQMNSGLAWNEDYGNRSDVTLMLHQEGNMGLYAWKRPAEHSPAAYWRYSSGSTNALSLALRESFSSDEEYWRFPQEKLFHKIGMLSTTFELDASGTFVGSSYIYATLRDYARFGQLYLNEGRWFDEQILSPSWVQYTKTAAQGSNGKYGASFWLNADGAMPDVPTDALMCKGHDGQFIVILPTEELVVVRTGYSPQSSFDLNMMIKQLLDCLRKR